MEGSIKSPRPVPIIMNEVSFSHRKTKKSREDDYLPPRAPVKSAPPVSRVFKQSRRHTIGALSVSFRDHGNGILCAQSLLENVAVQSPACCCSRGDVSEWNIDRARDF